MDIMILKMTIHVFVRLNLLGIVAITWNAICIDFA